MSSLVEQLKIKFKFNNTYSRVEIEKVLKDINKGGTALPQQNAAAYTYNRINAGQGSFIPLFEWKARSLYVFLGENFQYDGDLIHHKKIGLSEKVGVWKKGNLIWLNSEINDFYDWKKSLNKK